MVAGAEEIVGGFGKVGGNGEGGRVWADMKDKGFFWEGEEMSLGDLGQKAASPKYGGFFCIDPGTDMLLLKLKHHVLCLLSQNILG